MGMASEFREFAVKGNVVDLAVGVIIGGAFGKIVDSVVSDLIMPIVSRVFGGLDFSNYFIPLAGQTATTLADARKAGAVLAYGNFITVALNFLILAFIIFMMVKQINRLKRESDAPAKPESRSHARRRACGRLRSPATCAASHGSRAAAPPPRRAEAPPPARGRRPGA